jgi:hypothetical protein
MKWNHHKPLILELEPINGFFVPECTLNELKSKKRSKYLFKIPNKGYKNFAYALHASLTATTQTLVDYSGYSRIYFPDNPVQTRLNLGSSSNPHDVTRYELYTRIFSTGVLGIHWLVEETLKTSLITFHRYSFPPPDRAVGEVGLYFLGHYYDSSSGLYYFYTYLVARAIIDPAITKYANTLYEEGWQIDFPSNYTRWFLRTLFESTYRFGGSFGALVIDINGSIYAIRQASPWAGSPDLMIGSDNTPPSPTDYALKSPIGSLSSQAQAVEIDTTLQECRVVRTGTYTPTTNVTLGEVALFVNVYDAGGTARKIMVARGVWDTPVTLVAGTTYTIGIALRLG